MIKGRIEKLLSKEYDCSMERLHKKGTFFSVKHHRERLCIKILAYGNCVIVCTSEELHEKVQRLLKNRSRDEIFECPFVYGQTIHYVPDRNHAVSVPVPPGYEYEVLFEKEIRTLQGLTGFENALAFEADGSTPTRAVCIARQGQKIIGVAGAAGSLADGVWEAGVDVQEEYRGAGLGSWLTGRLTEELLARDIVPFYSASVTNLGSQMVAHRCGYRPMWVDTFGTVLDGSFAYEELVKNLQLL